MQINYPYQGYSEEPQPQDPQQMPGSTTDVMSYPMAPENQQTVEQLRYLLGSIDLIEYLDNRLAGNCLNLNTGQWEHKFKPFINDKGRHEVLSLVFMRLDKNVKLACLNEMQIAAILDMFAFFTAFLLVDYEEEWEIDANLLPFWYNNLVDDVLFAANIGKDGRMLNALKNAVQMRENRTIIKDTSNPLKKLSGGFGFFK